MRIASVSDLHVDFAKNREAVVQMATAVHRRNADLVIVAGDVSHVDDHIAKVLKAFRLAAPHVAYIPGNHDLWFARRDARSDRSLDSWQRYRHDLKLLVESEGCHYLPAKPLRLSNMALVGTCGWYDYSMLAFGHREQFGEEAIKAKTWDGAIWSDGHFVVFRDEHGELMGDEAVARVMERDLEAQLSDVDMDPEVETVVVATHVLAFRAALGSTASKMPWAYFNAFMGSTRLGDIVRSSKKVRAAVYGHTHRPGRFDVGDIQVVGRPLGYPKERKDEPEQLLIQNHVAWIDIDEQHVTVG